MQGEERGMDGEAVALVGHKPEVRGAGGQLASQSKAQSSPMSWRWKGSHPGVEILNLNTVCL